MPETARETMPVAPTFRSPLWRAEMVRLEVLAVPKYAVPLTVCDVDDAYVAERVVPLYVKLEEVASAPAPLPYKTVPARMFAQPVPPLVTARVPVTSLVSETVAQVATPAPLRERTN